MGERQVGNVWFITGASTGFGREFARQLLQGGASVVATARRPEQLEALAGQYPESALALELDVTDQDSIDRAVEAALERFGRVDVLLNNAGYGVLGAVEEASEEEFLPMFDTNVFGLVRVTRALLPQFRARHAGIIVNMSSIGGLIASPAAGFYNASKFAVNGLSEALAGELEPLGIHVMVVEPGMFRTDFLGRSITYAEQTISDYEASAGKARAFFAGSAGKQAGDPVRAVSAIIDAVESPEPPRHLVLGRTAFERMEARLALWHKELEANRQVSLGVDYAPDEAGAAPQ